MRMNKELSLLVCPICKQKLLFPKPTRLYCSPCKVYYPIEHGIPVLIDRSNLPKHLEKQIQYFQTETKDYCKTYKLEAWQNKYVDRLLAHVVTCKGKVVVDDGCGSAYISIELAKRGACVIACDLNMEALIRLKGIAVKLGLQNKILPACCSSENLPIRNKSADVIVANAVLEHLPGEQLAIQDITRIAKKEAVTMITAPIAYHLLNPIFLPLNVIHDRRIGHLRRYTKEMLVSRFSKWKLLNVFYTGHTVKIIKTLINIIFRLYDVEKIEEDDERLSTKKMFASNISIIFQKK